MKRDRMEWLKPAVVLLIALLAGPEFFLRLELLTLLDLVGVGLFVLMHEYALRMVLQQFGEWLCRWAVPMQLLARPALFELRGPQFLGLAASVTLFYLSWGALAWLSIMTGTEIYYTLS